MLLENPALVVGVWSTTSIVISCLALFGVVLWLGFLTYHLSKQRNYLLEHQRKLNLADHDIKTLHHNQKVLQSTIKEMRRDLLLYGEIKKSRSKTLSIEGPEES